MYVCVLNYSAQAAMVKRNSEMAAAAAELLTIRWGTEQLDVPSSMLAPYMRLIRLPIVVSQVYDNVELAMMDLYDASNISVRQACTSTLSCVYFLLLLKYRKPFYC